MKIAYLILAHDNPRHLLRLTQALAPSSSSIFIHIDRKSNLRDFNAMSAENVHVLQERVPVYWGDFSIVEATLLLMRRALAEQPDCDYFVLLSGTHYPLQSSTYIKSFFERKSGNEFIDTVPMGKPISRLTNYTPRPSDPVMIRFGVKIAKTFGMPLRRNYSFYLGRLVPYGGCAWWSLTRGACQYIQSYLSEEPGVVNFFKNTRCPDESFFQTILGNSIYTNRIGRTLTYADWSAHGSSPASIIDRHLGMFERELTITVRDSDGAREILFARKFADSSDAVLKAIDRRIAEGEGVLTPSVVQTS